MSKKDELLFDIQNKFNVSYEDSLEILNSLYKNDKLTKVGFIVDNQRYIFVDNYFYNMSDIEKTNIIDADKILADTKLFTIEEKNYLIG